MAAADFVDFYGGEFAGTNFLSPFEIETGEGKSTMEEEKTSVPTEFEIYNEQIDINKLPVFTLAQLAHYNGVDRPEIYVAIQGIIYDVTSNAKAYGPGKSYSKLVGKDVLRLLGLNSLKQKPDDSMPPWFTEDLNERQLGIIEKWILFFRKRYRIVGIMVGQQ